MHKLAVPLMVLFLTGCPGDGPDIDEAAQDTTAQEVTAEDSLIAPERASIWVGAGWVARTPNGRACVFVPKTAVEPGDSLRIEIERISPNEKTLPSTLPPPFSEGVLPPMYDFAAHDETGEPVTQFADSVTFAMCVWAEAGEHEQAELAHPDPDDPAALELLIPAPVPESCQLKCPPRGGPSAAQQASAPRGLFAGSPLTASPAYGAAVEEFKGIGGKGDGTSPFAAVRK